ncbi:hypothetical protein QG053_06715 [Kingella kingae]|uniref:hypothetical protein n=1 Tax=Kingella kingae TaxID=504 RepID=UPI00254A1789|nr:hypothetical protein [Kingella kingae]MDK4564736.1 hypothetical protein [Kingella kingae]MDK4577894.1 hypothetical protein [Kingella kingae]MDK4607706.1 hypothetical protein [Kingella kingae]MDK4625647.1 hypothetical protein [Kingella kingae]MDK4673397.1 hypothetical protein [Kingella kingae]
MKPEFEEKVYESWFNAELSKIYPIFFSPGQVCENELGFDAAFYIQHPTFHGLPISRSSWNLVTLFAPKNNLPNIKVNCFFQYKRPHEITTKTGKEWNSWNESYFRYEIDKHQQQLLEKLNNLLNGQALILYASPKTIKMEELYKLYSDAKLVEESHFTEAIKLINHHVNTYTRTSRQHKAFSESELIENLDFQQYLDLFFLNKAERNESNNFSDNAIKVAKIIQNIMSESEKYKNIFPEIIKKIELKKIDRDRREFEFSDNSYNYELLRSLYTMNQFKLLTGIQWCCYLSDT